jgi:tetratricopeptide (TPR) repeat protein
MTSGVSSGTLPCGAPRIGIDPVDKVFLFENHDQAYYIWRDAGVRNRTLVHIDAHHDMSWADDKTTISIGNFICPALKQELIQEIFWVVPDATFRDAKSCKPVLRHLKQLLKKYPSTSRSSIIVQDHQITTSIMEKKLTVCPLFSLPMLREAVLLDIDVDYLVIPRVSYAKLDEHGSLPWHWPSELIKRLHDTGIRSDLVTIAYSVEGGYTPLQWKYLGQEVMLRLREPFGTGSDVAGMCRIRQGAEAGQRGEAGIAESKYRQAQQLLPKSAAAPYRLARLLASQGRIEDGRQLYAQAVGLDGSYKNAYTSSGFHYYFRDERAAAEREFQDLLALDPSDAYCQLGLGVLALKRKRLTEAEQRLRTALTLDDCLLDAQCALGDTLAGLGRRKEAILAYEQALKLGVRGGKTLDRPLMTGETENCLPGYINWSTFARLARLYAEEGDDVKALNALRVSVAGGGLNSMRLRLQLARLYWENGQWKDFVLLVCQMINTAPRAIWTKSWQNLQRALHLGDEV